MDNLIRGIGGASTVRVAAAVTTGVVLEGARRHALSPMASCAVGRALTSGLLLATLTKGGERVTVQLVGDGPIGPITVDAVDGLVRGYAANPKAAADSVAALVGRHGILNVVRDLGMRELYQGQIPLTTGEVDEDVEAYLRSSEQVPSALGCEVVLDGDGRVAVAAGILVQTLPDGAPEAVREVQHRLRTGQLRELLIEGVRAPSELARALVAFDDFELVGDSRELKFQCRCSEARIGDMLALLSTVDLDEMIADDKPSEITCNFCNTSYYVERARLEEIRERLAPRQTN